MVSFGQGFVNYLGVGHYGHEVGIPVPAGHNVGVKVLVDTGSGDSPKVGPDVKAVRMQGLF